jgi:hypothetical protein
LAARCIGAPQPAQRPRRAALVRALAELNHFFDDLLAGQLLNAGILWVVYVALEPYVRRSNPEILISWTRLLGGRSRDPRVGRDLLVGIAAGIGVVLLRVALVLLPPLLGYAPPPPRGVNLEFLIGTRHALSALLRMPPNALFNAMLLTLAFVLMRLAVKHAWLAAVLTASCSAFSWSRKPAPNNWG